MAVVVQKKTRKGVIRTTFIKGVGAYGKKISKPIKKNPLRDELEWLD